MSSFPPLCLPGRLSLISNSSPSLISDSSVSVCLISSFSYNRNMQYTGKYFKYFITKFLYWYYYSAMKRDSSVSHCCSRSSNSVSICCRLAYSFWEINTARHSNNIYSAYLGNRYTQHGLKFQPTLLLVSDAELAKHSTWNCLIWSSISFRCFSTLPAFCHAPFLYSLPFPWIRVILLYGGYLQSPRFPQGRCLLALFSISIVFFFSFFVGSLFSFLLAHRHHLSALSRKA